MKQTFLTATAQSLKLYRNISITSLIALTVLSACATKEYAQIPVEVFDFPSGGNVASQSQKRSYSGKPAITPPRTTKTSTNSPQKSKKPTSTAPESNIAIYSYPKAQLLPNTPGNKTLMVQDLGKAGVKTVAQKIKKAPSKPAIKKASVKAPTGNSKFNWPANGSIIRKFGQGGIKGIEISGKVGDPVYSTASGSVTYTGVGLRGYGKLIVIKHPNNYLSVYAHNNAILVKEGKKVKQGEKIAELGDGEADRPKLLFQLRKGKKTLDPLKYLPKR